MNTQYITQNKDNENASKVENESIKFGSARKRVIDEHFIYKNINIYNSISCHFEAWLISSFRSYGPQIKPKKKQRRKRKRRRSYDPHKVVECSTNQKGCTKVGGGFMYDATSYNSCFFFGTT